MSEQRQKTERFPEAEREALYKIVFSRRDVRGQFTSEPVSDEIVSRILHAAHYAPSVGFMQPWDFIVIRSKDVRQRVRDAFERAHGEAAEMFPEDKRETYKSLKLEGILESSLNICVTCDRTRSGETVIGRTHDPIMDVYSSVCADQNLWLPARAEGLGMGWVSIFDPDEVRGILELPANIVPIAYLCVGWVDYFHAKPELELAGWLPRLQLEELVHFEKWDGAGDGDADSSLMERIREHASFPDIQE
jgi:5,6-dimethylbenzimidazole synthase